MEFNKFNEEVREKVAELVAEKETVILNEVAKNNGVILHGLTIHREECNISPTIYLDEYYKMYENGKSIKEVVDMVMDIYEKNRIEKSMDVSFFKDIEKMKEKIVYKLVNLEKNRTLLKEIPHIPFLDLAIVFYCNIGKDAEFQGTILITNAHLDIWKLGINELYHIARSNTPKVMQANIKNMEDIIHEMLTESLGKDSLEVEDAIAGITKEKAGMYILSNEKKIYGAACMLYPEVLKGFAEKMQCDFYILPSSIHEVILLADQKNNKVYDLRKMVQEVNETQVEEEEILSNSVYFYSLKEDAMRIA